MLNSSELCIICSQCDCIYDDDDSSVIDSEPAGNCAYSLMTWCRLWRCSHIICYTREFYSSDDWCPSRYIGVKIPQARRGSSDDRCLDRLNYICRSHVGRRRDPAKRRQQQQQQQWCNWASVMQRSIRRLGRGGCDGRGSGSIYDGTVTLGGVVNCGCWD